MNNLKKLYETPDLEEIVFASRDAIALSDGEDTDNDVDDDQFNESVGW